MRSAPADPPFILGYRPALDGMRALAILAVLGFHLGIATTPPPSPMSRSTHLAASLLFHAQSGYLGVQVFFVLSGFLITVLLVAEHQRRGSVSFRGFYRRRVLRLFPALFVLVAACGIYAWGFPTAPESSGIGRDSLATVLYFANWSGAASPAFTEHLLSQTWSLSIEEQFYVLWPVALIVCSRHLRRPVLFALTVGAAGVSWAERSALWHQGASATRVYYGLDTRGDALLVGCALGLAVAWGWLPAGPVVRGAVQAGGIVGVAFLAAVMTGPGQLAPVLLRGEFDWVLPTTAMAAAAILLTVIVAPDGLLSRFFSLRPLVGIGRLSYSLYLWHFPAFMVLTESRTGLTLLPLMGVRLVGAFGLAACSYYAVELPFLRLKNRGARGVRPPGDRRGSRRRLKGRHRRTGWGSSQPAPTAAGADLPTG